MYFKRAQKTWHNLRRSVPLRIYSVIHAAVKEFWKELRLGHSSQNFWIDQAFLAQGLPLAYHTLF